MLSHKVSLITLLSFIPFAGTAGQVAVVNPGSASGVAVAATTVTPTTTVTTPTTTATTPTTTATTPMTTATTPTTAPTLTRIISALTNSSATVTQGTGSSAASATSENNSGGSPEAASATPSSVSGYAPQLMATMQSVNVSAFTPQQANTLISIIEAQISQPGTPASVRQALTVEKARLAAIASN